MVVFSTENGSRKVFKGVAALVGFVSLLMLSPPSYAECSGVNDKGACVDLHTVQWCDNGALKEATCPEGEICALVKDSEHRYTCIGKSYTDCADIPDEGLCTSGNNAAWCVDGSVMIKECRKDEVCQLIEGGWVDCVAEGSVPPPDANLQPPDEDGAAASDTSSSDASNDAGPELASDSEEGSGPTPPVSPGDPYVIDDGDEDPGCEAGDASSAPPYTLVIFLLGLIAWKHRHRQNGLA